MADKFQIMKKDAVGQEIQTEGPLHGYQVECNGMKAIGYGYTVEIAKHDAIYRYVEGLLKEFRWSK